VQADRRREIGDWGSAFGMLPLLLQ